MIFQKAYRRYTNFQPFTDQEAWQIFKLAAFGEAIGWTLLILGIFSRDVLIGGNGPAVHITGQIHGMLFTFYLAAVLVLSPSLKWPLWRTVIAAACSVPPYGSLIYELVSAQYRHSQNFKQLHGLICYHRAMYISSVRSS
jgi:integral membrane protein